MKLSHEKAYVLGLLTAAGTISPNTFVVYLPYDQWGNSPQQLNEIMGALLTSTRATFKSAYGIEIEPQIGGKKNTWTISPRSLPGQASVVEDALEEIKSDLASLGLPVMGVLLKTADLDAARDALPVALQSRFLTGFFDARASLTLAHRHHDSSNPMVSIEMPASTPVKCVVQLCSWMTDLGSTTDQILFNHPSFHSGTDSEYLQWKKGYKVRISASSFFSSHKFGISPKSIDVKALASAQQAQVQKACVQREPRPLTRCVHSDLTSKSLEPPMRGSVYLHFLQACADLGCPHAPVDAVKVSIKSYSSFVSALSLCTKGTVHEIEHLFSSIRVKYFENAEISTSILTVAQVISGLENLGYSELEDGMKYLVAESLYGKRALGNGEMVISAASEKLISLSAIVGHSSDVLAPIMLSRNDVDRAVFLSSTAGTSNTAILADLIGVDGLAIRLKDAK